MQNLHNAPDLAVILKRHPRARLVAAGDKQHFGVADNIGHCIIIGQFTGGDVECFYRIHFA